MSSCTKAQGLKTLQGSEACEVLVLPWLLLVPTPETSSCPFCRSRAMAASPLIALRAGGQSAASYAQWSCLRTPFPAVPREDSSPPATMVSAVPLLDQGECAHDGKATLSQEQKEQKEQLSLNGSLSRFAMTCQGCGYLGQ